MSRWHARLAEIRAARQDPAHGQNGQNGQNPDAAANFVHSVHSVHFDQPERLAGALDRPAGVGVVADTQEEQPAVIEYNCRMPLCWAEALARLDPARPPADIPPNRWLSFIDACAQFGADGWAEKAIALGWQLPDLLGCDRAKPLARYDRAGLLWLLKDWRLVAITAESATIETPTGARQTYYKVPIAVDDVALPWEL
jgi:hypothetical protein